MKHPQESPELLAFHGLDPALSKATRSTHIALVTIGTILMVPALFVIGLFGTVMLDSPTVLLRGEYFWAAFTAVAGSTTGGIAWCALCLLLFKSTNPWWHRAIWPLCALFGAVTIPSALPWLMASNWDIEVSWIPFTLILALISAIFCLIIGFRFTRLAHRSVKRMEILRHQLSQAHQTHPAPQPPHPATPASPAHSTPAPAPESTTPL